MMTNSSSLKRSERLNQALADIKGAEHKIKFMLSCNPDGRMPSNADLKVIDATREQLRKAITNVRHRR